MPLPHIHLSKARHNLALALRLSGTPAYKDWTITVCFYAALHVVEALLYSSQPDPYRHGQTHGHREGLLKRHPEFEALWTDYRPLAAHSRLARYLQSGRDSMITLDAILPDAQVGDFIRHRLGGVLEQARSMTYLDASVYADMQATEAFFHQMAAAAWPPRRPVDQDLPSPELTSE